MEISTRHRRVASQASNRAWLAPAVAVALVAAALLAGAADEAPAAPVAEAAPRSDSVLPQRRIPGGKIVWPAERGRPQGGSGVAGDGPDGFVDRAGTRWA